MYSKEELVGGRGKNLHGTILRNNGLKKTWNKQDLEALQRVLARLVSPFNSISNFSIRLELPPLYSEFSGEISPPEIVKYPHYTIKGKVEQDGRYTFSVSALAENKTQNKSGYFTRLSENGEKEFWSLGEKEYQNIIDNDGAPRLFPLAMGPLEIDLMVWDRDELGNVKQVTSQSIKEIRKDLDEIAGVNIYRDDFRVLPYGEPNNDWLRLDMRRVQKPVKRLSNNQIVGYISISSDKNPDLRDKSNREGLDENQSYKDLVETMIRILEFVEDLRSEVKSGGEKNGRNQGVNQPSLFSGLDLGELKRAIKEDYPDAKSIIVNLEKVEKEYGRRLSKIKEVVQRYRGLSVLGSMVDIILHDGRHPLDRIGKDSILGKEDIEDNPDLFPPEKIQKLYNRFENIAIQKNNLATIFRRIEPLAGRKKGRPQKLYLEEIIKSSFQVLESEIDRLGVNIELPQSRHLVSLDPGEIQQIIINLLDNSLYWLKVIPRKSRKIQVSVERNSSGEITILFSDSGPGVSEEMKEKLFLPYESGKPNGIGLGLSIAGEIIKDFYEGDLDLVKGGDLGGATFRITLRKRIK